MSTIVFTLTRLAPRIESIADYAAGLLAIQRHGITQNIWIHPDDHKLISPLITAH
jgi:hypothetical protein